ncbi:MAG: hypothetical protein EA362_07600 [Saprospirales bacterium]|nr:MAG: hypothetical protein EA362_07600 [Saprospirales bacterium]
MNIVLIYIIISLFAMVLILNIYFRVKVFKQYKYLVKNRVQFRTRDIFNSAFMEREIYPKYPEHEESIRKFIKYIRFSMRMAIILVLLITAFGAVLMYYR